MDPHKASKIKGLLGAFFFVNFTAIFSFFNAGTLIEKKVVIVINLIIALIAVYFAFKLEKLSLKLVRYTVLLAVIFTAVTSFLVDVPIMWLAFYMVVGIYLLVSPWKLNNGQPRINESN